MNAGAFRGQKHQVPWSRSYMHFELLELNAGPLQEHIYALNHRAVSPAWGRQLLSQKTTAPAQFPALVTGWKSRTRQDGQ